MMRIDVRVVRLPHATDLPLPSYQSALAAGCDLVAAVADPVVIAPGRWAVLPTGLAVELPLGVEAQVRPRSGLAARSGLTVLNSPGTIDADYRGEISVVLGNFGEAPFWVTRGMRVAQLVISPIFQASWVEVDRLDDTGRNQGGFGSTGIA